MAIREVDEPVHRCSRQIAHEVPVNVTLGPTSVAGITTSMITCENGVGNSLGGGVAGS